MKKFINTGLMVLLCLSLLSGCKVESVKQHQQATGDIKPISLIQSNLDDVKNNAKLGVKTISETDSTSETSKDKQDSKDEKKETANVPNQNNPNNKPNVTPSIKQFATISIDVKTILNNRDKLKPGVAEFVPDNGIILAPLQVEITGSETVLDILKKVTNDYRIKLVFQGSGASSYIQEISNIREFDCGQLSGWMYTVNGSYVNMASGAKIPTNGDVIRWVYTCDNGRDI
ncbi:MAG: DUF4430 domain-containing protein [Erysipelotrichaceae bacterium]